MTEKLQQKETIYTIYFQNGNNNKKEEGRFVMDLLDRLSDLQERVNYLETKDSMRRDMLERALSVIAYYADCDKIEPEIKPDGTVSYWKRKPYDNGEIAKRFLKKEGCENFQVKKVISAFCVREDEIFYAPSGVIGERFERELKEVGKKTNGKVTVYIEGEQDD